MFSKIQNYFTELTWGSSRGCTWRCIRKAAVQVGAKAKLTGRWTTQVWKRIWGHRGHRCQRGHRGWCGARSHWHWCHCFTFRLFIVLTVDLWGRGPGQCNISMTYNVFLFYCGVFWVPRVNTERQELVRVSPWVDRRCWREHRVWRGHAWIWRCWHTGKDHREVP